FYASVGRTDLPGGDTAEELASIRERLFPLGDLPVFPGHGPSTTIGQERVSNPFVGSSSGLWTPGG
ncbi:MAG TPA: MBL fold metallo-hydrolase, partial [Actinomycetota bacterium]